MEMGVETIVMNLSGVYSDMSMPEGVAVDCRDIEGTSCYCDASAAARLRERMEGLPLCGIHFIDSGDYHYISKLWLERVQEPFSLVLFDHHPDMQEPVFPEVLSCGGWVDDVLSSNPNCRKVVIVGANPELAEEAMSVPDRVWLIDDRHATVEAVSDALPFLDRNVPVYLSIDKDVMDTEWARTDWDQGRMSLQMLESCIRVISERFKVLGVDICGEIPAEKEGTLEDWKVNSLTNVELASFLGEIMRG